MSYIDQAPYETQHHTRPALSLPFFGLPRCELLSRGCDGRAQAEAHIVHAFKESHGAHIDHFLPVLAGLSCNERFQAVAGIADASKHPLFAEHYLDMPIDKMLSKRYGITAKRSEIVEIGNLASNWKGSSLLLLVFIGEMLYRLGFRWCVFTATPQVAKLLARLDFAPQSIADADPSRLPDGGAHWGRYYDTQPQVLLGDLSQAIIKADQNPASRAAKRALNTQIDDACALWRELDHE
ncbi:thermostable hemolysin [uncultured Gilvimarinus sp.]|uniref:thermostable hemolysin n=1 Tax=uncultured Gilvimarinus sp. TaxID=1689143 RepID=UPI0030D86F5F